MSVEEQTRPGGPVVGYVLKMYPRFSETFIVSEILAREAAGENIVIFSLRPPVDPRFHPELARVKAPVIYIERPSSATKLWLSWQSSTSDEHVLRGATSALAELLQATHDDATQSIAVAAKAREYGVTHLHAHFASMATTVARLASLISGISYSFTAHAKDIFHENVNESDLAQKFNDAHHVVTISDHNLRDLNRRFPEQSERLHRIYNGLELNRFPYQPVRPKRSHPRVLAVGRLVEKKGFDMLIEATRRLRLDGIEFDVDITGDGPLRAELERAINAGELSSCIRLIGPQTQHEVAEMLRSHDLFVAPFVVGADGNADGLPTVLLEAMASGIPCVAADVTGVGEVIRDGETGWLVPTGDLDALIDAMTEALNAATSTRSLIDKARSLVEDNFDSRRQAEALARLTAAGRKGLL